MQLDQFVLYFDTKVVKRLAPNLRCITAPNPGIMTGEGTNTYIVGQSRVAVVDPGPAIESHIDAIVTAVGSRLEWIIVTHTHRDHSPGAAMLAGRTGAKCLGMLSSRPNYQDPSFTPDQLLEHNKSIVTDEFTLRAIHTPGHVDNHYCLLLENDGILMAGDHLMNGSTVVIIPPQGDMREYINSLQRLLDYDIQAIAPGHGNLIKNPEQVIRQTIAHRLNREKKVMDCLLKLAEGTVPELVVMVYDDVDKSIHRIAESSLLAHLIKLEAEGRVQCDRVGKEIIWRPV